MQICRTFEYSHPILKTCVKRIQEKIIDPFNMPIKVFETGRNHERHQFLISKGKTKDIFSTHVYNIESIPVIYSSAVDFVYYENSWSWNLRDNTVKAWYNLFGHMVLDICPELSWGGWNRKAINYNHFELTKDCMYDNIEKYPCILPL